jgi:hypothetical protein
MLILKILDRINRLFHPPLTNEEVVKKLHERAEHKPECLNWDKSIVDLLKLLDLDSSYDARSVLACEMHLVPYTGTEEENEILHRIVMEALRYVWA